MQPKRPSQLIYAALSVFLCLASSSLSIALLCLPIYNSNYNNNDSNIFFNIFNSNHHQCKSSIIVISTINLFHGIILYPSIALITHLRNNKYSIIKLFTILIHFLCLFFIVIALIVHLSSISDILFSQISNTNSIQVSQSNSFLNLYKRVWVSFITLTILSLLSNSVFYIIFQNNLLFNDKHHNNLNSLNLITNNSSSSSTTSIDSENDTINEITSEKRTSIDSTNQIMKSTKIVNDIYLKPPGLPFTNNIPKKDSNQTLTPELENNNNNLIKNHLLNSNIITQNIIHSNLIPSNLSNEIFISSSSTPSITQSSTKLDNISGKGHYSASDRNSTIERTESFLLPSLHDSSSEKSTNNRSISNSNSNQIKNLITNPKNNNNNLTIDTKQNNIQNSNNFLHKSPNFSFPPQSSSHLSNENITFRPSMSPIISDDNIKKTNDELKTPPSQIDQSNTSIIEISDSQHDTISKLNQYLNEQINKTSQDISSIQNDSVLFEPNEDSPVKLYSLEDGLNQNLSSSFLNDKITLSTSRSNTRHSPTKSVLSSVSNGTLTAYHNRQNTYSNSSNNISISASTILNYPSFSGKSPNMTITSPSPARTKSNKRNNMKLSLSNISDTILPISISPQHSGSILEANSGNTTYKSILPDNFLLSSIEPPPKKESIDFSYVHSLQNHSHSPTRSTNSLQLEKKFSPSPMSFSMANASSSPTITSNSSPTMMHLNHKYNPTKYNLDSAHIPKLQHSISDFSKINPSTNSGSINETFKESRVSSMDSNSSRPRSKSTGTTENWNFYYGDKISLRSNTSHSILSSIVSDTKYPDYVFSQYDREKYKRYSSLESKQEFEF